ncbi:hypothetical protein ATANTOWER_027003 [Ataeniobius toweri]|uniref:Uncharacterized protein n=1 Tax=Ataeniobius toweri TaxID=208326 RepID=A0ABU7A8K1_9TELE|nr:hypothetical protein [Ataeniobius toweri]
MQKESVSHRQARLLLHNKFVVVLGDSIQRSVYKDLVVLLQKDKYLTLRQLRSKASTNEQHVDIISLKIIRCSKKIKGTLK